METKIRRYGFLLLLGKEQGIVMAVAIMIMLLLTVLGLGALLSSSLDLLTTRSQKKGKEAFYAAEGGIVYGTKELGSLLATTLSPLPAQLTAITAPSISGFNFDTFSIEAGDPTVVRITTGPYAGLNSNSTPYIVTVQASGTDPDSGTVRLAQSLEDQLVPLFQFGVLYNDDLELFPGPGLTFNGRIHSNSDIYIGGSAEYASRITSAGNIFRCRKDNPSNCDSAQIKTPPDPLTGLTDLIGLTYDHTDPDWVNRAYDDWGGLVQDSAHGVRQLNIPVGTSNPADLIKRGDTIDPTASSESQTLKDSRLYWKAGLRIIDGTAYDKNGNFVDLTDGGAVPNPISTKPFYDYREGKLITATEVDVNLLQGSSNAMAKLNDPPAGADPGIIYMSETQDTNNSKAIRLTNGATLPTSGLTVATDNPIYVKGNYNCPPIPPDCAGKKGAAIMGDAVTFLSNSWSDEYGASTSTDSRPATATTVNAAVATGNATTSVGNYNGGLENLPRFLENWSGVTFTYTGSLIDLWRSQQATGAWRCCASAGVYAPPNRNWSYDISFDNPANLPPGTPRVRTLALARWARQ